MPRQRQAQERGIATPEGALKWQKPIISRASCISNWTAHESRIVVGDKASGVASPLPRTVGPHAVPADCGLIATHD
jgi:hypothetical protein